MTLNQVIKRIETIALSHKQLNTFRSGGDLMAFLRGGDLVYPACVVQFLPGSISRAQKYTTYRLAIYLCDLVNVSKDTKSNELEVQSDLTSIAEDLTAMLYNPIYTDWDISEQASLEYAFDDKEDITVCAILTLDIHTYYDANRCQVPTTLTFE
jgi:hypothetical protein